MFKILKSKKFLILKNYRIFAENKIEIIKHVLFLFWDLNCLNQDSIICHQIRSQIDQKKQVNFLFSWKYPLKTFIKLFLIEPSQQDSYWRFISI